jgi:hypothetical protein
MLATGLLRSTAYFHGNGGAEHFYVLLAWIVAGFVAMQVSRLSRADTTTQSRAAHAAASLMDAR